MTMRELENLDGFYVRNRTGNSNLLNMSDEEFEGKIAKLEPYARKFAIKHRKHEQALKLNGGLSS